MSDEPLDARLDRAAEALVQADGLLVTAGAGMGVDSGLPDFRGNEGFWRAYPALGRAQIDFYQAASPASFRADPRLGWGFYGHRLGLYRDTVPHAGFELLRRWAEALPRGAFVFTSNVDGQFQQAGFGEAHVHECHGSLHHLQCLRPCTGDIWLADAMQPDVDADACQWRGALPTCPRCGGLARPNVLMFGDGAWLSARTDAQEARLNEWLRRVSRPAVIELGAGTAVPTVRWFSERCAGLFDVPLVRVNLRESEVPSARDVALPLGACAALQALDARVRAIRAEALRRAGPPEG
jgi:NAD-dependent SIR2 family protein deacetylase